MTHDFLNDLQVGFVLAEASAECVPQDMAAKLWQKNRVTIFFLRLGFFFLIIVCTNRADSAVDGIGEINLSIASAENKAGVPINFIGAETNDLLILVFFQKGIEHFINHWNNADASFRFGRVYMVGASAIFLHTINKIVVDSCVLFGIAFLLPISGYKKADNRFRGCPLRNHSIVAKILLFSLSAISSSLFQSIVFFCLISK